MGSRIKLAKTVVPVFLVAVILAGCAGGPRRQTYWVNPGVSQDLQQQRFTIDATECRALAIQMIPEPSPPPQPQSGNITLNTPNGLVYGTYQNQPAIEQGYQPGGFLGGVQRAQRTDERRNYAVACMGNRGWQERQR